MKVEVILKAEQIREFTFDLIKNQTPDSTYFLTKVYGTNPINLAKFRPQLISLINNNKQHLVFNLLLGTISPKARLQYITSVVIDNINLLSDDILKIEITKVLNCLMEYQQKKPDQYLYDDLASHYEYLTEKRKDYQEIIVKNPMGLFPIQFEEAHVHSQFIKGILYLLDNGTYEYNASSLKCLRQMAEANQWCYMRKTQENMYSSVMTMYSNKLIDYVGFID